MPKLIESTFNITSLQDTYSSDYPTIIKAPAFYIVLSAVTGVGKSTIRERILNMNPNFNIMRVFTNRNMRNKKERKYNQFGNIRQFSAYLHRDEIFCYCKWQANQNIYALLKSEVSLYCENDIVLCAFDCFGSALQAQNPNKVINIWLTCENKKDLRKRLINRGTESLDEVEKRYKLAIDEQDFIVNNKQSLLSKGKIDHFIDTSYKTPSQLSKEITLFLTQHSKYKDRNHSTS